MVSYKLLFGFNRIAKKVLILVVMEDGLVLYLFTPKISYNGVLILVVMEDGLVHN